MLSNIKKSMIQLIEKLNVSILLVFILSSNFGFAQTNKQKSTGANPDSSISNPNFDKALAEKLGGDAYGMKSYFFVILKTGSNKTTDKTLIGDSFSGHLKNIRRLVDEGKLIVAGPLAKNANQYRGIFIFDRIKSIEEVKEILNTDLAIKNGLLDYDVFTWFGSAALPEYLPSSEKIWKTNP